MYVIVTLDSLPCLPPFLLLLIFFDADCNFLAPLRTNTCDAPAPTHAQQLDYDTALKLHPTCNAALQGLGDLKTHAHPLNAPSPTALCGGIGGSNAGGQATDTTPAEDR